MKNLLKAEQAAQLALTFLAIYFQPVHISWWIWPFLFLSPDAGMLGYLLNAKAGAWTYNLFHHKGVAATAIFAGFQFHLPWVLLISLVIFGHSSFDRLMGYGLKYPDSFSHTHLGYIGKNHGQASGVSVRPE